MPDKEMPDPAELEEIFASIDPTPVRMAHDYLNEAGIESFVFDAGSSRMLGHDGRRADAPDGPSRRRQGRARPPERSRLHRK